VTGTTPRVLVLPENVRSAWRDWLVRRRVDHQGVDTDTSTAGEHLDGVGEVLRHANGGGLLRHAILIARRR